MADFKVNQSAIEKIIRSSPQYKEMSRKIAQRILETAKAIYVSQSKGRGEPPHFYAESFRLEWNPETLAWRVINDDPVWMWVEYGAHAGGKTAVLKYRPLGRALDVIVGEHH